MTFARSFQRSVAFVVSVAVAAPSLAALTPSVAYAQTKRPRSVGDMLTGEAKQEWERAIAFTKRGDADKHYDETRAAFLRAYELSKNPRVLFNVASMEARLQRYAAAIDTFKRELNEGKGVLSTEEEVEIKSAIAGLEKYVMSLSIEVTEPGAKVFVDDLEVGTAPLKDALKVTIGSHRIRASKTGFGDANAYIDGSERNPKVTLKLEAINKSTKVSVAIVGPKSAVVKIDGREVGTATPANPYSGSVSVQGEPHQFSVEATGFVTASQPAVAREGEPITLSLQMSEEQAKGKLIVVASPPGSTIEIDGKLVGSSRWDGPVEVGTHQVQVKKRGYYSWSYDVSVPRGGERSVTANLNEDRNTSFVPWLIGSVLVIGGGITAAVLIAKEKDQDPVRGNLPPSTVSTPAAARF